MEGPQKIGTVVVAVMVVSLIAGVMPCIHAYADPTCTDPAICEKCGETSGEPLGHTWHEATCTEPKTCSSCGLKDGTTKVHNWGAEQNRVEATCSSMGSYEQMCSDCGKSTRIILSYLDHEFGDAVITQAASCSTTGESVKTCASCGAEELSEIPLLEHQLGEWVITKAPTAMTGGLLYGGERSRSCTACGAVVETEDYNPELTLSERNALGTAMDYLNYSAFSAKRLIRQLEYEGFSREDAQKAVDLCGANWNEQAAKCAQEYLDYSSFSRDRLIRQLEYEGFTPEQAEYGVTAVGY